MKRIITLAVIALAATVHSATYYVDYEGGSDSNTGTSEAAAWKHAPGDNNASGNADMTLAAGDVVSFKGGVYYRSNIKIQSSGTADNPVTYKGNGWGAEKAVIDGSAFMTGWTKCTSADDCGGNPNWENIYYTYAPAGISAWGANLHEEDQYLWLAQEPDQPDPYFADANTNFIELTAGNMTRTSITDPNVFNQADSSFWEGSYLLLWTFPNIVQQREILEFIPAENKVVYDSIKDPDGYDRYAIYNSLYALDQPGEYYFDTRAETDGTHKVYLWPRSATSITDGRINYSVRPYGIDIGSSNYVTIEGFQIQKHSGDKLRDGIAIGTYTGYGTDKDGITLRHNELTHNSHEGSGYGGINLRQTHNSVVESNYVHENKTHAGMMFQACNNIHVRNNIIRKAGNTSLRYFGCTNSTITGNTIYDGTGTHANGISAYLSCKDVLVANNKVWNCNISLTYESSENIYIVGNYLNNVGKMSKILSNGSGMSGTSYILNNTLMGSYNGSGIYVKPGADATFIIKNNIIDGASTDTAQVDYNLYTELGWKQSPTHGWELGPHELFEEDFDIVFKDTSDLGFQLAENSPAVDAGADLTADLPIATFPDFDFTRDMHGTLRGSGAGWDIGALEYSTATVIKKPAQIAAIGLRCQNPVTVHQIRNLDKGLTVYSATGIKMPRDTISESGVYYVRNSQNQIARIIVTK